MNFIVTFPYIHIKLFDHIHPLPILALILPLPPSVIVSLLLSCFENFLETAVSSKFAGKKNAVPKSETQVWLVIPLYAVKSSGREVLTDLFII